MAHKKKAQIKKEISAASPENAENNVKTLRADETEKTFSNAAPNPIINESNAAPSNFFLIGSVLITLLAAFLRFFQLTLKPFHHDEGVNGFFLKTLYDSGVYHYDPTNYHGPTLYFLSLAASLLGGLNDYSVRSVTAFFGTACVVLILFLRREIGEIGALAAALLVALAAGHVYISRYFIHEIIFVFFSLGIVTGVLFFLRRERAGMIAASLLALVLLVCFLPGTLNFARLVGGESPKGLMTARLIFFLIESAVVFFLMRFILAWNGGRPIYLLLAAASAALYFATKETAFITLITMFIAFLCVWVWEKIWLAEEVEQRRNEMSEQLGWQNFAARMNENNALWLLLAASFALFAYLWAELFTSFFTYREGLDKSFEAYYAWTKTGTKDHTQNGGAAYLKWIAQAELPLLILSALGAIWALLKNTNRFAVWISFTAFGLFAAYSLIPYKTPWLALNFTIFLGICGGYFINALYTSGKKSNRIFAAAAIGISAITLLYYTIKLNFYEYDNDKMPYVYAHTRRGYNDLIAKIEAVAAKSSKAKDAAIYVVSPDYWAMPWSLREYDKTVFFGEISPANSAEMIVASETQRAELPAEYGSYYKDAGTFPLRPGVDLILLVRRDLADAEAKEIEPYTENGSEILEDTEN